MPTLRVDALAHDFPYHRRRMLPRLAFVGLVLALALGCLAGLPAHAQAADGGLDDGGVTAAPARKPADAPDAGLPVGLDGGAAVPGDVHAPATAEELRIVRQRRLLERLQLLRLLELLKVLPQMELDLL